MEVVMSEAAGNKEFVTEYLRSLSGRTKTPELVKRLDLGSAWGRAAWMPRRLWLALLVEGLPRATVRRPK